MSVDEVMKEDTPLNNKMICDKLVNGTVIEMQSLEISNFSFETTLSSIKRQFESLNVEVKWNDLEFGGLIFIKSDEASVSNRAILLASLSWLQNLVTKLPNFSNNNSFYIRNEAPNGNNLLITKPFECLHGELQWIENKQNWIDARNLTWISREWLDTSAALDKIISIVRESLRYFIIETVKEKEYIIYRIGFYSNDSGRRISQMISDDNNMIIEGRWNLKLSMIPSMMDTDPEFIPLKFSDSNFVEYSDLVKKHPKSSLELDSYVLHRKVKEKAISRKEAEKLIGLKIRSEKQFNSYINNKVIEGCKPFEDKNFRGGRGGRGGSHGHSYKRGYSSCHHRAHPGFFSRSYQQ